MSRDIVERLRKEVVVISDTLSAPLLDEAADALSTALLQVEALTRALERQCDNMAFVVNHVTLHGWYDKFKNELEQAREALRSLSKEGETNG